MIKVPLRAVLLSLIAVVAIGGLAVPNISQIQKQADSANGNCIGQGVGVVIDFGSQANRDPIIQCVSASGLTGWQLLESARLEVVGTREYPESFVCRIKGFPTEQQEDCIGTPGASSGSWTYFYADASSIGWKRSPVGAATRIPECGEIEGWLFTEPAWNSANGGKQVPQTEPKPFICE